MVFIATVDLLVGDKLVSVNGEDLFVENYSVELTEEPIQVYNFQVEDFHTYFVGDCEIWVHNDDKCTTQVRQNAKQGKEYESKKMAELKATDPDTVDQITIKVNKTEERVRVDFASGEVKDGVAIKPKLTEAKSSDTATFTKAQKTGYPNLAKYGGEVVGKGKGQFVGQTKLPPTEVNIARPSGTNILKNDILGKNLGG